MAIDLFSGFATIGLKKPMKPIKTGQPKELCLHPGEDNAQYSSFLETVKDLAMAFKFLPDAGVTDWPNADVKNWRGSFGIGYQNFNLSPNASQWDLITGPEGQGINTMDQSVLDDINAYFSSNWSAIKSMGGSQSYYQVANGSISSFSDEDAFNFMCSMLESRQRVYGALTSIFGPAEGLIPGPDGTVKDSEIIDHITSFMKDFDEVDTHNIGVLHLFFGMQTDFLNEIDAYIHCKTFWGGDNTSNLLMNKVENYIATLSGDQKNAAEELEVMWTSTSPGWGMVGAAWTKGAVLADNSWAKFFRNTMDDIGNKDAIRTIISSMFNRSAERKYKKDKAEYEEKKDEAIQNEIWLQKMMSKALAQNKKNFRKRLAGRAGVSKAQRIRGNKGPSIAGRVRPAPKPRVHAASIGVKARVVSGMKTTAARVAPRPRAASAAPVAAQAQKRDSKKVI